MKKRMILTLVLGVLTIGLLGAGIAWKEAVWPSNAVKTYHLYPSGANYAADLGAKYGEAYAVKYNAANWTDLNSRLHAGDMVLLYPGTYTLTATLTLSVPGVTIKSATGNPNSVIVNADATAATADFAAFTLTAAADGSVIKDVTINPDADSDTANTVNAINIADACDGVTIENVTFKNSDTTDANDTGEAVSSAGAYTLVKNCQVFMLNGVAFITGNEGYNRVEGCLFSSVLAAAKGVTTYGVGNMVMNNQFDLYYGTVVTNMDAVYVSDGSDGHVSIIGNDVTDNFATAAEAFGENSAGGADVWYSRNVKADGTTTTPVYLNQ